MHRFRSSAPREECAAQAVFDVFGIFGESSAPILQLIRGVSSEGVAVQLRPRLALPLLWILPQGELTNLLRTKGRI